MQVGAQRLASSAGMKCITKNLLMFPAAKSTIHLVGAKTPYRWAVRPQSKY
jgi:hypothetical protein